MAELTKLETRCKLCSLLRWDAELWKEVHRKVFVENVSRTKAETWINERVDMLNASPARKDKTPLPHFSKINFAHHFKNHITEFAQVEAYLAAQSLFSSEARANPTRMVLQIAGTEMEDYLRLESLINASGAQLSNYERTLSAASLAEQQEGGCPAPVNLEEVKVFQKLVQAQMAMKKELAILQVKQAVAGSALREAMERVVEVVMNSMQDSMVELRSNLHQQFASPELAEQLTRMVAYKIGEPLKANIPSILDEVYKKYKIR